MFKKGQILLITLIVLTIIGIITVSVVILVQRDTNQVSLSEEYEESYSASEGYLNELLNKASDKLTPLEEVFEEYDPIPRVSTGGPGIEGGSGGPRGESTGTGTDNIDNASLESDTLYCNDVTGDKAQLSYLCVVNSNQFSKNTVRTEIEVNERNYLEDYTLLKDKSFDFILDGYNGEVTLSWSNEAAMEISVVYDSGGVIGVVKDVYDPLYLFASYGQSGNQGAGYNHIADPLGIHPISFEEVTVANSEHAVRFTLANTVGISGSLVSMRVTPRSPGNSDGVTLSLSAPEGSNFPTQIREFTAKSYTTGSEVTPIATLITTVPLAPQTSSLFDYALLTNGEINF